jgi:uncharacterized membrane protein YuzA (DUF378 family)
MTDALIAAFATGSNPANWTTLASLLTGSAAVMSIMIIAGLCPVLMLMPYGSHWIAE